MENENENENALFGLDIALLCVCGGGIIPNVLSAVVLVKERNSIPGAWILLGLSVADGGLLFAQGCFAVMCLLKYVGKYAFLLFVFLHRWLWMAGIYLAIALAVGRYVAVNKPHLARVWNKKGRQGKAVTVIFTVTLLVILPMLISKMILCQANVTSQHDTLSLNQDPGTTTPVGPTFFRTSTDSLLFRAIPSTYTPNKSMRCKCCPAWLFIVDLLFSSVFLYLIPLPCIVLINIRFLRGLRRFQSRRKRFAQTQTEFTSSKQVRIILNVAVILAVFLVCQAISLAMWAMWVAVVDRQEYHCSDAHVLRKICFFFTALNSAVNFWVYLAFLKEFRRAMVRMVAHIYSCIQRQQT